MKKKVLSLLLGGTICLSLCACTVSPSTTGTPPTGATTPVQASPAVTTTPTSQVEPSEPPVAVTLESSGALGDYTVEIKDMTLAEDYSGKPAIIITYSFTNNGAEATSAMVALHGIAYQNGVQLDMAIVSGDDNYNAENSMKDIKTGGTLDINEAYLLRSETAPVEYELSELISFSDELLGKTFAIADGGATELAAITVPTDATTGTIGDFEVSIISCEQVKDYEGKDAILVTYGFKNNGDKAAAFVTSTNYVAYQDGVQLSTAITMTDGVDLAASQIKNIKPGAAILVAAAYTPTSTSEVEVEVSELFSFDDTAVSRTFNW